ncbi:GyrI-like domain-containing protein [Paenibacillus sp. 1001270B_150601_E10]|uniref:GyrI-like domain-containing protein n=1 Tax=Paenibacillus sp. 1001270B_150601_E10 TaxID=2787079 RepID=UPI00189CAB72|nr:GyrI-like domain-containing protein [Paenibacillus sp. 1001270B_150601_E10]
MNNHVVHKPSITLAGVTTRTTNAEEAGSNGRLPKLWETYFKNSTAVQAYSDQPAYLYALYTDYESDASGAYTVLIGHELKENIDRADMPFEHAAVPESEYLVFTSKKGPVYEVVAQAWMEIWNYFNDSKEVRAYTGDFELYDASSFDPANAEVRIYIAIQS